MERLSLERIKAAILHPDKKVRNTVLLYFEHSHQTDATIMPLVTQAYDRFGDEAFESHWILPDIPQTMDTVAWLLQTIERVEAGTKINQASSFASSIIGCLLCAEPTLLDYHATSIQALRHLDAQSKTRLKNRLAAYAIAV